MLTKIDLLWCHCISTRKTRLSTRATRVGYSTRSTRLGVWLLFCYYHSSSNVPVSSSDSEPSMGGEVTSVYKSKNTKASTDTSIYQTVHQKSSWTCIDLNSGNHFLHSWIFEPSSGNLLRIFGPSDQGILSNIRALRQGIDSDIRALRRESIHA